MMRRQNITDDPGEPLRYVYTTIVRCPACRSTALKVYGHKPNCESLTQYANCKTCDHKFLIVNEEPEI